VWCFCQDGLPRRGCCAHYDTNSDEKLTTASAESGQPNAANIVTTSPPALSVASVTIYARLFGYKL
jgi:hypothetical protein